MRLPSSHRSPFMIRQGILHYFIRAHWMPQQLTLDSCPSSYGSCSVIGVARRQRRTMSEILSHLRVALGVTCVSTHSVAFGCVSHANALRVHLPVTHELANPRISIGVALQRPGCCHRPVRTHSYMSRRDNDLTLPDNAQLSSGKITLEIIFPSHPRKSTPDPSKATIFLGSIAHRVYAPVTSHAARC
jgi:hypothetical protein